jgi:hypothetical protein
MARFEDEGASDLSPSVPDLKILHNRQGKYPGGPRPLQR